MVKLKEWIRKVELRAKIDVLEYLDWGLIGEANINYLKAKNKSGYHYIGEVNPESQQPRGRGIMIDSISDINIGMWYDGEIDSGAYILIHSEDSFEVGYRCKGESRVFWSITEYYEDGSSSKIYY